MAIWIGDPRSRKFGSGIRDKHPKSATLLVAVNYSSRACIQNKKCGKSRLNEWKLFNNIHKHSFGGLRADTLNFRELTPFSGEVGGGACRYF